MEWDTVFLCCDVVRLGWSCDLGDSLAGQRGWGSGVAGIGLLNWMGIKVPSTFRTWR